MNNFKFLNVELNLIIVAKVLLLGMNLIWFIQPIGYNY